MKKVAGKFRLILSAFILLGTPLALAPTAGAVGETCIWTGSGVDNNFSNPDNWSGCGGAPTSGMSLFFDTSIINPDPALQKSQLTNDIQNLNVQNIMEINSGGQPDQTSSKYFTISSNTPIGISGDLSAQNTTMTINSDLILNSDSTFSNVSTGNINLNNYDLYINGLVSVSPGKTISGIGNIRVGNGVDSSHLSLNGNNTWAGLLHITSSGSVTLEQNDDFTGSSLGSQGNAITIDDGGTLTPPKGQTTAATHPSDNPPTDYEENGHHGRDHNHDCDSEESPSTKSHRHKRNIDSDDEIAVTETPQVLGASTATTITTTTTATTPTGHVEAARTEYTAPNTGFAPVNSTDLDKNFQKQTMTTSQAQPDNTNFIITILSSIFLALLAYTIRPKSFTI